MVTVHDSYAEQLARVRQMVAYHHTWHLSERDREALEAVLSDRDVLRAALETAATWCDADLREHVYGSGPTGMQQSRVNQIHGALTYMEHRS